MVSDRSYTRITLALDIIRKIPDGPFSGYHELAVIKHQIDLHDVISIDHAPVRNIICNDPQVPCDGSNICWKAVDLVKEKHAVDDEVSIRIDKNIPVMGGLAGGSANAATTLMLLDRLWGLGLEKDVLEEMGRKLGMDVPFYFTGGTALDPETAGGVTPLPSALFFVFVLVVPRFGVSTKDAYAGLDYATIGSRRSDTEAMIRAFRSGRRDDIFGAVHNDFEPTVFRMYPALHTIKSRLTELGCAAAFLSGSGSTVIGICRHDRHARMVCETMKHDPGVDRVLIQRTLTD